MALLYIRTIDSDPHNPSEVLALDTDQVVRRPWVRDADLCLLAWLHQDRPKVHTLHLSFAASAVGKAFGHPHDAPCGMEILPPRGAIFDILWQGSPFFRISLTDIISRSIQQRFVRHDHMDDTARPVLSGFHTSDDVEGLFAGVLSRTTPAFDADAHDDPMVALDALPPFQDSIMGPHATQLLLDVVFPGDHYDPTLPYTMEGFLASTGLVLHDRPVLPTRAWRTPAFDAWARTTSRAHRALGQALAPRIQNLPEGIAQAAHRHLLGTEDRSDSAHIRMEGARLVADLRAIVQKARP